jgi:membrane protein DedA with SNARE-associated domain/pimeloyl-ACP methyl ester carboxylesterase
MLLPWPGPAQPPHSFNHLRRRWLYFYLGLLLISQLVGALRPERETGRPDWQIIELQNANAPAIQLCYRDLAALQPDAPTLLLLHGSPGSGQDFEQLAERLKGRYRLLIPDLPGFGRSTLKLPDYSFASHALYLDQFLRQLESGPVHVVAFSMAGGVALKLYALDHEKIASLTMLSALGVQELELFGRYDLNHAIHGFQVFLFQAARWLLPHFGGLDRTPLGKPYVRNFFDSDQRPLRGILENYDGPVQIIHGVDDFLVPIEAAREHARLLPQSELIEWPANHFLPWTQSEKVAEATEAFVERCESGQSLHRAEASAARLAQASLPWNPSDSPPLKGAALLVAMLLLAAATLVSEDLTCIATGLLVAQGRIEFIPGVVACFVGIFIGDGLLFLAGRWLGSPVLSRWPLRWMVSPSSVTRAKNWFAQRGGRVILLSRFLPGLRLPTYVAAGILGTRLRSFLFYFALAGLIWTPLLVGISTWAGRQVLAALQAFEEYVVPILALLALSLLLVQKLILPLFSHRGRRMWYGTFRRRLEWEFLPVQIFYLPVAVYIGWLALRYRSLRVVTLVNPGIFSGGLVGESKAEIMQALDASALTREVDKQPLRAYLPQTLVLKKQTVDSRLKLCLGFLARHQLNYPVIIKPDRGERGHGVELVRSAAQLRKRLQQDCTDLILQEYISGQEFGVFYARFPGQIHGQILSINQKHFLSLTGDGKRTLEQLILDDDRAVRQASIHFDYHAADLLTVPTAGLAIPLVEIGAHSRGTVFLDACLLATPGLLASLDHLADAFPGFNFGRIDLRTPDAHSLQAGENLAILEINGLSAEAAHIYDPKHGLFYAWKIICQQWKLAFLIGAANQKAGAKPARFAALWQAWRETGRERNQRLKDCSPVKE